MIKERQFTAEEVEHGITETETIPRESNLIYLTSTEANVASAGFPYRNSASSGFSV